MNFSRDVVDRAPADGLALVELRRDGTRREWTFGEVSDHSARLAGAFRERGVGRGDVVMTLVGNRSEWVLAMLACFRIGAVALACTEQLRSKDLRLRLDVAQPRLIVADERNREQLELAGPAVEVVYIPDARLYDAAPAAAVELDAGDACLLTFTSGTTGPPKAAVHAQRYLAGQHLQAEHWLDARPGDLVWCTAATGWSKSARNIFVAPWTMGAATLLHDARFDPAERVALLDAEQVDVLCMAPTEYRMIAKASVLHRCEHLRATVAAGEALDPEVVDAWHAATGVWTRDGYGQTETGQITAAPPGVPIRRGSMGRPLPGITAWVADGELLVDPATVPTFFRGYLGEDPVPMDEPWHTGDQVTQDEDGWLYFQGRKDDIIVSSGYRIGPVEVESVLASHPAVAEVAVVAAGDPERGSIVRAIVVVRDGHEASPELAVALQDHVKRNTAPYKYPRVVDFAASLPKTATGKIQRASLRA